MTEMDEIYFHSHLVLNMYIGEQGGATKTTNY